jgi:single-stranded DNA-binding protein
MGAEVVHGRLRWLRRLPRAAAHRGRGRKGDVADGGAGRREQEASFFTVIVWRDQAEHAAESLTKGSRVVVVGRLQQWSWTAEDGSARSTGGRGRGAGAEPSLRNGNDDQGDEEPGPEASSTSARAITQVAGEEDTMKSASPSLAPSSRLRPWSSERSAGRWEHRIRGRRRPQPATPTRKTIRVTAMFTESDPNPLSSYGPAPRVGRALEERLLKGFLCVSSPEARR